MTFTSSGLREALPRCLLRVASKGIGWLLQVLAIAWATLAIYFSNLPWRPLRVAFALVFLAFGVWALPWSRKPRIRLAFVGALVGVMGWWLSIRPSPNCVWRPEVAVMPRVVIDGDHVRINGFRNFDYRSTEDFDRRYETREVSLTHLTSVDLFISYWKPGVVAHTFLSFGFDNAPPVCISIEVRPEQGKSFSPLATLFKQFQLIYVVGDERDLVRVRTNYRREEVYLYRVRTSPEKARELFRVYLARIDKLAEHPEFYHLLKNSCTVNVVRYANAVGRTGRFDYRHLLNGLVDRYLYDKGLVDTSMPFIELRRRSRINEAAQAADKALDFSARIRASLPAP